MAAIVDEVYAAVTDVCTAEAVVADGDEVAILGFGYGWDSVWTATTYGVEEVLLVVGGEGGGDGLTVCGELVEDDLIGLGSVVGELAVVAAEALAFADGPLCGFGDGDGEGLELAWLGAAVEVEGDVAWQKDY